MNLQARHTCRHMNQLVATQAQSATLVESLNLAGLWARMADTFRTGPDYPVYRARAYAFLARACELDAWEGMTAPGSTRGEDPVSWEYKICGVWL